MGAALQVAPIHAQAEPFRVVTVPGGSAAHRMGYRFVSVPESELPYYLANGATLANAGIHRAADERQRHKEAAPLVMQEDLK